MLKVEKINGSAIPYIKKLEKAWRKNENEILKEITKVFESFSRGVAGTKLHTKGAGLGLCISRCFVELHKGKIWVEYQPAETKEALSTLNYR